MDNLTNTFKSLLKFSGKALFVIGLVLNICVICFGFWPSFVYILIMLAGAALVALNNNDTDHEQFVDADANWFKKSYNAIAASFKKTNQQSVEKIIKNVFITLLAIVVLLISALVLSQDYFKKRDTINSCRNIITMLDHYKQSNNVYPANISALITQNPLLSKTDLWGNSYKYSSQDGIHFILISAGQDGKFNTSDDLIFKN